MKYHYIFIKVSTIKNKQRDTATAKAG